MKIKARIQTSRLLNSVFDLPGIEPKKIQTVEKAWNKIEKNLLKGLEKITALSFKRNILDIFLVHKNSVKNSISHPAIIMAYDDVDTTICVIIHELIHSLLWDNAQEDDWSIKVRKIFSKQNRKTAIHIVVHALLEAVYKDILKKPGEIERDIERCKGFPDYKRAWEIVIKKGYKNIISLLKYSD